MPNWGNVFEFILSGLRAVCFWITRDLTLFNLKVKEKAAFLAQRTEMIDENSRIEIVARTMATL